MKSFFRGCGLLLVGVTLGQPVPGDAQTSRVKKPISLIGTWEKISGPKNIFDQDVIRSAITFRSSGTWLDTAIRPLGGDTLSCTTKQKVKWSLSPTGDTLVTWQEDQSGRKWAQSSYKIVQQDSLLSIHFTSYGDTRQVDTYKRLASPVGPFRDRFAPRPMQPATGKLAGLAGAWQWVSGLEDHGLIRQTLAFRSDTTYVNTEIAREGTDTLPCTTGSYWRMSGDTMWWGHPTMPGDPGQKIVVKDDQLSFFDWDVLEMPRNVYRRVSLPKRP